jgi:hypothetical protein
MGRRDNKGLPVLRETELERAGVDPAVLRQVNVHLGRGGSKWHVPTDAAQWSAHCRHAMHLVAAEARLLDVLRDVCKRCVHLVSVRPGQEALWRSAADVVAADRVVRALVDSAAKERTWSGYAAALAGAARHHDETVRGRLAPWTGDAEFGPAAQQMTKAWTAVLKRSEETLAEYRRAAPAARDAAAVSAAGDVVAADGTVRDQGLALAAAVERSAWATPFDAWAVVRSAWTQAREQRSDAAKARAQVLEVLEKRWGNAQVRDVSALPRPARTSPDGFSSPAAWADAEFQHLWQAYAVDCCERLDAALDAPARGGTAGHQQQLLLVTGWPLTTSSDTELAYLAQYEQDGPAVPNGGRHTGYQIEPVHAVVLAVPVFAARHAAEHTRGTGRITLGPALTAGREKSAAAVDEADVHQLLRTAYPYLVVDAERDGAQPRPTDALRSARETRRTPDRGGHNREDSAVARYNALVSGTWSWVPDDTAAGTAAATLSDINWFQLADWTLRLDVECGPRPRTGFHSLYGAVTSWDPESLLLGFSPVGGHSPLKVPVHRIVALSGDRHRRRPSEFPVHEPYEDDATV